MNQFRAMQSKRLAEQSLGPIANDGTANRTSSHQPNPIIGLPRRLGAHPVQNETPLNRPSAGSLQAHEVASCTQPVTPAQTQPVSGCCGHGGRRRNRWNSDRRQAATTLAAAIGDVGPPSLGGHAGTEPMLADAANLLRLVLTFHGKQIRGSSGAANLINHEVRVNHHVRIRQTPTSSLRPSPWPG